VDLGEERRRIGIHNEREKAFGVVHWKFLSKVLKMTKEFE